MRSKTGILAVASATALLLAACSPTSESATPTETETMAGPVICAPVPGDTLVVLADDLGLQTVDNIIPAVNAESADDAVIAALDTVSGALDTDTLIGLNKRTDIDFETSADVAADFVETAGLSAPMTGEGSLVVGAFNFSESITVAEIYGIVLRDAGYDVEVRAVGNRETVYPALTGGELDIVPEYVGTLTEFVNKRVNGDDAAAVASGDLGATVSALTGLGDQVGLAFGAASAAQDQNAFAVTQAFADEYGVSTLSELSAACDIVESLGGPVECPERPFCQPGLEGTYGLEFGTFESLDVGGPLTKTALTNGDIAVGLVFSSDGSLG